MFQKNLEAIRAKNPKLAERLEQTDFSSITGISVLRAESNDLIIAWENTPLHSTIDPIREAKAIWNRTVKNELGRNDIQIVFGLGIGYLFKRAYVSAESKIFLVEPNIAILRYVLEYVDLAEEFSSKKVYVTDTLGDIYNKLQSEYLSGDKIEFLFLDNYALLNQEILGNFTSKTCEIIESRKSDENTTFKLCRWWAVNSIKNFSHFSEARPLGYFEGKFNGKTALIVSAGPGLAEDIEKIKDNQDKFVIISVGRAFKTLVKAGIIPDFTVFLDAQYCNRQVQGVENFIEKTNIVFHSKSDHYVSNLKSKSKILYFTEADIMAELFTNLCNDNKVGFYKSGSSVSIISYYLAKALGFSTIIFSGLDLSFINNKMFADGMEIKYNEQGKITNLQSRKLIYVKDRNGDDIPSRDDYALFIRQFSEIFTEEINLARIINTSLNGAFINGMEYVEISEVLKTLPDEKHSVNRIINKIIKDTAKIWDSELEKVYPKLQQVHSELKIINQESKILYEELDKICTNLDTSGKIDYSQQAFDDLYNKVIDIRQKTTNNILISNAMQDVLWNYTRNYVVKPVPDRDELITNLKLDRTFFMATETISLSIYKNLENTLKKQEEKCPAV